MNNAVARRGEVAGCILHTDRGSRADFAEARLKIITWITGFYNPTRRHSLCGGMSPVDYETSMATVRAEAAAALSRHEAA
ncbi:hypothetical protein [Nocardia jiangxiensis]|uniref:hypothetical protein n=1 Tax=Nocardia jiangxiensis TaxID=282685 RepID=UPI0002FBBF4B|nr:hypothetical protein [Nocardia jiangxiensis]